MDESSTQTKAPRSIWLRGLIMILLAMAYQVAGTVLFFIAIIQFILALLNDTPNPRLMTFGSSVGRYQAQIADFVSFTVEKPPFPFADWP